MQFFLGFSLFSQAILRKISHLGEFGVTQVTEKLYI